MNERTGHKPYGDDGRCEEESPRRAGPSGCPLRGVLECARTNADAALSSLKQAIDPLQPILQMVSVIADIAGQPMAIALPDLSTIKAGADASQALQPLKDAIAGIEAIVDAIPG